MSSASARVPGRGRRSYPSSLRGRGARVRNKRYRPLLERLEDLTLLATVSWINPAGGDWNNLANWSDGSTNRLPGASDDVVIDMAGSLTITHASGSTSVRSIQSQESLNLSGGTLTVTAASTVAGDLTLGNGAILKAVGASASLTATGSTTLGVASLYASSGGVIDLPMADSYPSGYDGGTAIQAVGAGSRVALEGLSSLRGFDRYGQVLVRAIDGGSVDLSALTTIPSGAVQMVADGAGSQLDLSGLDTWQSTNPSRRSSLELSDGGTADLGACARWSVRT